MPNGHADAHGQGIETRTQIFLDGVDGEEMPLVNKVERTGLGLGGMTESTEIRLRQAIACGHVLHTAAEVGAACSNPACQSVLCTKCAGEQKNMCGGCGRLVCGTCRRRIWLRKEDSILCPACARRWWLRELLIAGCVALLAFLALAALLGR